MPAPVDGVTLEDKIVLNEILLSSGLSIDEMNHVRQQTSKLKGGGLLHYADPAPVTSYILSDVIGNDLRVIASGPTVSPLGTKKSALDILASNNLLKLIPQNILNHFEAETSDRKSNDAVNYLIGDNRESIHASAESLSKSFVDIC
jgi:hydroxypyruvate reductase